MRSKRRRLLDLTPLLDVIMILLFGTMINSVELARLAKGASPSASPANSITQADLDQQKSKLEEERLALNKRWQTERGALLRTLGRLAGLSEKDLGSLDEKLQGLAQAPGAEAAIQLDALKRSLEGEELARAIARLREMQKVFSFVDLHVDESNFLTVKSDGEVLERLSVLDRSTTEIAAELRRVVEPLRFSEVVLILFSYDGQARDRVIEATEGAVNTLVDRLRTDQSQRGRQFRVGRVGMVRGSSQTQED
jgi:hypothetical protein